MASPNLRSKAGESSTDAEEPIEGAEEGCAQLGVKAKLRDSAHTMARVHRLERVAGDTEMDAEEIASMVGVKVVDCLAIRL
jgi:hypothetical protein